MAESTLSLKRDEIRQRIALYCGYGLVESEWDTDQIEKMNLFLSDGLRAFETPMADKEPYEWSFRKVQGTVTTGSGTQAYDLPDDFQGIVDWMTVTSGSGAEAVSIIPVDVLLQKQALEAPSNGTPQSAAIRNKGTAPSTSVSLEWEVLFFPTPGGTHTVQFTYPAMPDSFSTTSDTYTSVPPYHVQTLVAACLACAESYLNPDQQVMQQNWQSKLQASVAHDQQVRRAMEETFAFAAVSFGEYHWFARRIGKWLGYGWNYNEWTNAQSEEVDDILQRGQKRFFFPPPVPRGEGIPPETPHNWSFLSLTGTIVMVEDQVEYDLPLGFQGFVGDISWPGNTGYKSLHTVDQDDFRGMQSNDGTSGTPLYASILSKTQAGSADQERKVAVYPRPNADAALTAKKTLSFRYKVTPALLTVAAPFPYGGTAHAETILAACRCVWAEGGEQEQVAYQAYIQRLSASIQVDKQIEADTIVPWTITAPAYGSYDWLLEEVGAAMGEGANNGVWTHDVERRIDSFVRRGYETFMQPHTVSDPNIQHHRWSFLYPTATLTTVAAHETGTVTVTSGTAEFTSDTLPTWAAEGDLEIAGVWYEVDTRTDSETLVLVDTSVTVAAGTSYSLRRNWYDLPSTLQEIEGPLTYAPGSAPYEVVVERTEEFVRQRRQYQPATGYARYFALSPTTVATAGTGWKLAGWPNWDGIYVLTYRYKIRPAALATGDYPLGGEQHAETILASCLALVEPRKYKEDFMMKMAASVRMDQREHSPSSLGIGYDSSDFSGHTSLHGRDNHSITYLGQ